MKLSGAQKKINRNQIRMESWTNLVEWNALVRQIERQQCVLVVGPDILTYTDNKSLFHLLCEEIEASEPLRNHVETSLKYGFEHEELLQLRPNAYTYLVYDALTDFYNSRKELDEPFEKISELPFHLIISLFPDKRILSVFDKNNRPYEFSYFSRTDGANKADLEGNPSREKPLIYNILGVLDNEEAVITFDNMFEYLQNILFNKPSSLPEKLIKYLENAKSFLFLGVHFEKWYMQVLLRVLLPLNTVNNNRLKYSFLNKYDEQDIFLFYAERLELKFLPSDPMKFLNELHASFKSQGLLRKKRRVFISYSHKDRYKLDDFVAALENAGIEIFLDELSMSAGEKIKEFMDSINQVDMVIVILSKNSIQSPYISKEVELSIKYAKSIIPCHIDEDFLKRDQVAEISKLIDGKLREINKSILNRLETNPLDSVFDLSQEQDLWRDFGRNIGAQIAYFQGVKSISLIDGEGGGIDKMIQNVLK